MEWVTRRTALVSPAALASAATLGGCGDGGNEADTAEAIANPGDNVITDTSDPQVAKESSFPSTS